MKVEERERESDTSPWEMKKTNFFANYFIQKTLLPNIILLFRSLFVFRVNNLYLYSQHFIFFVTYVWVQ